MDSEARAQRVAAQKQHGVLFLGRGLKLCSLSTTMRETATQFPFPNLTIATFRILCYNKSRRIRVRLIHNIRGGRYDDLLY